MKKEFVMEYVVDKRLWSDTKRALGMTWISTDHYRQGDNWRTVQDHWQHEEAVDEIKQLNGRFWAVVGREAILYDFQSQPLQTVKFTGITMKDVDKLTSEDYERLGLGKQPDTDLRHPAITGSQHIWFIDFEAV